MKVFISLIFSLLIISCSSLKPEYISGTRQPWWSTSIENSKGTIYHLVIQIKADSTRFRIDSILINNCVITEFKCSVLGKSNMSTDYQKGDSVLLSFNKIGSIDTTEIKKEKNGRIFYISNSRKKYCSIDFIKTLSAVLCP